MIFDPDQLLFATVTATFAVAVLACMISWSQRWSAPSRTTLALFFAAFALSELDTLAVALTYEMPQVIRDGIELKSFIANFCIMPLFLFYVRELSDLRGHPGNGKALALHFALPGVVLIFSLVTMALPATTRDIWYSDTMTDLSLPGLLFLHYGFTLLTVALVLQWAVYVIWVARTQARHIARLKQHFASTEGIELRWVAVLAFAMGSYILQTMAGETLILLGKRDPVGPLFDSFLVLIVVAAVALWGLRPSPELDYATKALDEAAEHHETKYKRSALGIDQSHRIAQKLLRAMQEDHLYRDPNLTLSALSAHVGVSLNHVSQTLNQNLGQSFFEFVNSWRVKEAIPLVEAGETTVLAIAYEVGFNSRSSFYSAFKRVTDMTPTAYKKAKSKPPLFDAERLISSDQK
ncbi:AraC family transcriptional regulator [uncultured Roseobacter sp.]|uniref:helix-turn-helix domain-containing protein n=1 Tax=uncultured Roseobacter sp. TaxID=114847 RepID=UPI00261D853E|nr:AraC family transcriptional regulator [uncultured Roseobacter sp.]